MIQVNHIKGEEALLRDIQRFAQITGRSMSDEIVATARLVAVSLAHATQPYGKGKDVKEIAERRVSIDIHKIFRSPSSIFNELSADDEAEAKGFWAAFRAGDDGKMNDIMIRNALPLPISPTPDYAMHQGARNSRGRVKGKNLLMVKNQQALSKYIAQRKRMVGFAKAGWSKAADACGGHRGIMAWASSRHPGAAGGATITRDPIRPGVLLHNSTRYIRQILPDSYINQAVEIAFERLYKRLKIVIAKNAANFRRAA